jgi:hypothetical protein
MLDLIQISINIFFNFGALIYQVLTLINKYT